MDQSIIYFRIHCKTANESSLSEIGLTQVQFVKYFELKDLTQAASSLFKPAREPMHIY
jgi:hypothetical protein